MAGRGDATGGRPPVAGRIDARGRADRLDGGDADRERPGEEQDGQQAPEERGQSDADSRSCRENGILRPESDRSRGIEG